MAILYPFATFKWDTSASLAAKQNLVRDMINSGYDVADIRAEISRLEPDKSALTESNFNLLGLKLPEAGAGGAAGGATGYVQTLLKQGYSPAQIRGEIARLDPTPVEATSFEQLGIPIPRTGRSTTERTGGTRLESGEMEYNIAPLADYEVRAGLAPTGLLNYGYGQEQGLFSDIPTASEVRQTQAANLAAMQAAAPTANIVAGMVNRGLLANESPTAGLLAQNQALMNQVRDVSTKTALDKAAFYNNLRGQGYSDQEIQNIVGSSIGFQTPQQFNYLRQLGQTVQMAPELQERDAEGKASYFNDLLNSGLNYDQALSVINTGVGQQTNKDLLELARIASAQRAQPMAMLGTAPGAFSQGLLAGGFPSVAGQTLLGFGAA
jgi:hypothetical protein